MTVSLDNHKATATSKAKTELLMIKMSSFILLTLASSTIFAENLSGIPADILKSEDFLDAMSNEFNKTLPIRIDQHIEMFITHGEYSHYTLVYRTVNLSVDEANDINLIEGIKTPSTAFICGNSSFKQLLKAGVLITAKYVASDYKNIGAVNITKDKCSF